MTIAISRVLPWRVANDSTLKESLLGQKSNDIVRNVAKVAKDLNCTVAQLSLAWCLKNPNVCTAIVGARTTEQLKENLQNTLDILPKLTSSVLEELSIIVADYDGDMADAKSPSVTRNY